MKCKLDIKKELIQSYQGEFSTKRITPKDDGLFLSYKVWDSKQAYRVANDKADSINNKYSYKVALVNSYSDGMFIKITPPEEMIDSYYNSYIDNFYKQSPEQVDVFGESVPSSVFLNVAEEIPASMASPETIKIVKEFLKRIGVDIETLSKKEALQQAGRTDWAGIADITEKIVYLIEGREKFALPEEAAHFAVEIVKQTNPTLYKQMFNKIGNYALYREVLNSKRYQDAYQTAEGKLDIAKLKDEAIGKVVAEYIMKGIQGESSVENLLDTSDQIAYAQNWWDRVIDWIKSLFISNEQYPFEEFASQILSGRFKGAAEDIKTDGAYFQFSNDEWKQSNPRQSEVVDKINQTKKDLKHIITVSPTGERLNYYEYKGEKVQYRVTEETKKSNVRAFGKKDISKDIDESMEAKGGTAIHSDIENIISRCTDEDGFILRNDDGSINIKPFDLGAPNTGNWIFYKSLEDNIIDRLQSYPLGTRVLTEVSLFDPNYKSGKGMAGSVDFLAILPDKVDEDITSPGGIDILDWKSMNLNLEKQDDVPWYKRDQWSAQITQYKRILSDIYKYDKFRYTRAIPIIANYYIGGPSDGMLKALQIGNANVDLETNDYLLPVSTREESTGIPQVDKLVQQLYKLYDFMIKHPTDKRKDLNNIKLNQLYSAIRYIQTKKSFEKLFEQTELLYKINKDVISKVRAELKKDISSEDAEKLSKELRESYDTLSIYAEMDSSLRGIFSDDMSPDEKELHDKIQSTSSEARYILSNIKELRTELADKEAKKRGILGILIPENVITGLKRGFGQFSTQASAALRLAYKITEETTEDIRFEKRRELDILEKMNETLKKYGKDLLTYIKKKGSYSLIDQYDPEFYKTIKEKIDEKDASWIYDNIDVAAFEKAMDEKRRNKEAEIRATYYPGDEQNQNTLRDRDLKFLYDETTLYNEKGDLIPYAWLQYKNVKNFPKTDWYSKEYKDLLSKPDVLEFYNYIRKWNDIAEETGYLHASLTRNFLPFLNKGLSEDFTFKNMVDSMTSSLFDSLTLDPGSKVDIHNPFTGERVDILPKYFTNPIENEGDISTDIVKNIAMYVAKVVEYKNKQSVQESLRNLQFVEKHKDILQTNQYGEVVRGAVHLSNANNKNLELLNMHIRTSIYNEKNADRTISDAVAKVSKEKYDKFRDKLKRTTGITFPEIDNKGLSLFKFLDSSTQFFRLKQLGLSLGTPVVQLIGGTAQGFINGGKWWTKSDFAKAEWKHATNFIYKNDDLHTALMKEMMPLDADLFEDINSLSQKGKLSKNSISDVLLKLLTKADHMVAYSNWAAFMDNTIIIDGKIQNAREYYRNSAEYRKIYNKSISEAERTAIRKGFDAKVKELIEKHSLISKASIDKNGNLKIDGIELNDPSFLKYKTLIRNVGQTLTGNLSKENSSVSRMNAIYRAGMVFKNWIPRNLEVRFGGLSYNEATESFEQGRIRDFYNILGDGIFDRIGNITKMLVGKGNVYDIIRANDKGLNLLDIQYEMYKERFFTKKGINPENLTPKQLEEAEKLFPSKEEFFDLLRQNIKNEVTELKMLIGLLVLFGLVGSMEPPDKEDRSARAFFNYNLRVMDRMQDELSFYYNPVTFENLFGSSAFPAIGILKDVGKATSQILQEGYGTAIGDDEIKDKAHPLKYVFRALPVFKEANNYIAFFSDDLAKEMDIQINPQSSTR
jgi:hypothetical protein